MIVARYFADSQLHVMQIPEVLPEILIPVSRPYTTKVEDPPKFVRTVVRVFKLGNSPRAYDGIFDYFYDRIEYL